MSELLVASGSKRDDQEVLMAKVFVGHDWAEAHHDVFNEDSNGRRLGGQPFPDGIEGVASAATCYLPTPRSSPAPRSRSTAATRSAATTASRR